MTRKKTRILLFIICFLFYLDGNSQNIDSIACRKVEDTLKVIENFINDINSDPHLNRIAAVKFFNEFAKIPYEGKVTFIGPEFPSKSFYLNCRTWYFENKEKLKWDVTQSKIVLKKE